VSLPTLQGCLREVFTQWGLPDTLRLDNGYPWGHSSELPTALTLWLAGLDLPCQFNPPRQPRFNGVVEKSHDTSSNWAEPQQCGSVEELQSALLEADRLQREEYPLVDGLARLDLFATLPGKRRAYHPEQEVEQWQESLARACLGQTLASRRVSKQGKVSVYARDYHVGLQHRGQAVFVQYDSEQGEWLFSDRHGVCWCRQKAEQITRERLLGLSISAKESKNQVEPTRGE
jgi:hypothetical protein